MSRTANEQTGVVGNASLTDSDGRLIVVGADGAAIGGAAVASVTQSAHTTSATPGTTTDVLASDATRKGLSIINTSDTDITLHLGSGAGTAGTGVVLKAGGGAWDGLLGLSIYTGQIRSVCAAASKTLAVVTA